MDDKEKISAAIKILKQLKRMVGFFMKGEILELVEKLESTEIVAREEEEIRSVVGSMRQEGIYLIPPTSDLIPHISICLSL